ncbi:CsgG/HfaB family protein [Natronospora cellulosivora (SeqCode)]
MIKKISLFSLIFLVFLSLFLINPIPVLAEAPLVAVLPVEEGDFTWKGFRRDEILNGITQLLTDKLVEESGIRVVERTRINDIIEEQDFVQSGRVDAETAARIGRILGVDALILTTLTELNVGERGGISFGPISVRGLAARVVITGRVVDATTAEITSSHRSEAEVMEPSISISDIEGISFGTNAFWTSVLGKSIDEAVDDFTNHIVSNPDILRTNKRRLEGRVAAIIGNRLVIDIGSIDNVRVRQSGELLKMVNIEGIIDPVAVPIGEVEVSSVNEASAIVDLLYSEVEPEIGDYVRLESLR